MASILKKSQKEASVNTSVKNSKQIRIAYKEKPKKESDNASFVSQGYDKLLNQESTITYLITEEENYEEEIVNQTNCEDKYVVCIEDVISSSDSSSSTSSEEENETRQIDVLLYKYKGKLPQEYWQMPKIIKLLRTANQTGTIVVLKYIYDLLQDETFREAYQYAFLYNKGLEILVNILETNHLPSVFASLKNLEILANKYIIKRELINLGIIYSLLKILTYPAIDNQIAIINILANLARLPKARRMIRVSNGIRISMEIDICDRCLQTKMEDLSSSEQESLKLMIEVMNLWWSLALSEKCREVMRRCNFVEILSRYLKSVHEKAILAAMGSFSLCCKDEKYQVDLITIDDVIKNMLQQLTKVKHNQVRRYTFRAIANIVKNNTISKTIREFGGIPLIVNLMKHSDVPDDEDTMAAVTSAIFALANNDENREVLVDLELVPFMVELLQRHKNEDVLANAVGTLSEFLKIERSTKYFKDNNGIGLVVNFLSSTTHQPLIINALRAIEECANYPELIPFVEEKDGIRWIWSLIRHKCNKVKAQAAWCLAPLLRHTPGSGEIVKNLVGGFESAMELLKSKDNEILAAACGLLAEIANDSENLDVLIHFELIPQLTRFFDTRDEKVQEYLSHLIASSCCSEQNTKELTRLGAISLLIVYLQNPKLSIKKSAMKALSKMSKNQFNCITIKESGIDKLLRKYLKKFDDKEMQDESIQCLKNIRKFCMDAERKHFKSLGYDSDDEIKDNIESC